MEKNKFPDEQFLQKIDEIDTDKNNVSLRFWREEGVDASLSCLTPYMLSSPPVCSGMIALFTTIYKVQVQLQA